MWYAALAALVAPLSPSPLTAQDTPRYEEGYFDLVLQRVGRRIGVPMLVDGSGRVLIPLRPVLDHTGIAATWTPDSVTLEWPPRTWRTVFHYDAGTIVRGDETVRLGEGDWVRAGVDVFLAEEALETLIGTGIEIVFADLSVLIAPDPVFPAIRRADIELRRRFDRGARTEGAIGPAVDIPYPARTGGFVTAWGLSLARAAGDLQGASRGAAGASLWGGAIEGGLTLGFGDRTSLRLDDQFLRWTRGFPLAPWIRQLQLGTFFSEGPAGRRLFGGGVTNAPFTTPRLYGEAVIEPAVPTGWEYEVYQGDYLIGVGSREEPGGIRTPLNYGNTPVRVRMIGPSGQETVQDLVYVVRPEMVPAGEWQYGAGAGACVDPGCDAYGWAELRHGLGRRFTLGAGVDHIAPDDSVGQAEWRPYIMATGAPLPGLGADVQYQPGAFLRSTLQYQSAQSGSVIASYAYFEPSSLEALTGWNAQLAGSWAVPLFGRRYLTTRLLGRGIERDRLDSWQASVATTIRQLFASVEYEHALQTRDVFTARAFASWPRREQLFRDVSVTTALGLSREGFELAEVGATTRLVRDLTISASLRGRHGVPPAFVLGMSYRFAGGYAQARATQAGNANSLFLSADGGVAGDPYIGAILLPFESIGRAGVAGIVYEDANGDGVRSPDDPRIPGAVVTVGAQRVVTDETGSFHTWLLQPYEAAPVALDSLSIPFDRVPAVPYTLLRPSPNLFTRIDVAAVRTREASGTVESPDGLPVAGIGIEIVDENGTVVSETRTFRDGGWYIPRLRPGVYHARIAASSLAAMQATSDPADRIFGVTFSSDEPILLAPLYLRR